jgi:ABC-type Fe3+-siderophore transport system permease subunit
MASLFVLMIVAASFAGWLRQADRDPDILVFAGVLLAPMLLTVISSFFQGADPGSRTFAAYVFLATLGLSGIFIERMQLAVLMAIFAWPIQLIVLHEVHNNQSRQLKKEQFEREQRKQAVANQRRERNPEE